MADIVELARRFSAAGRDNWSRSPFYSRLNQEIANDAEIVSILASAPDEQQLPVLLLAAVHSIVLAEPDIELARWYATTCSEPLDSNPFPAFARLCAARDDDIRALVSSRTVQTNEVGRCALLLPGLASIADAIGPISLIDIGTSAGLNLHIDRYRYAYEPGGRVGPTSTVVLECGTQGNPPIPTDVPEIRARVGVDRDPIDVTDPADARWLMACVWPDQADRFQRLRHAIEMAVETPPQLVRGDLLELVGDVVHSVASDAHPVVINSWVLNYLPESGQRAYVAALDALGEQLDLSWVYAESPGLCPGVPFPADLRGDHITALMTRQWRDGVGTTRHLGTAHPHGYWWHAPR